MTDSLPPLPELGPEWTPYWTKKVHEQMQNYARAAIAQAQSCVPAESELFHEVMGCLRDMQMPHGLCKPRSRMACTNCNASDRLQAVISAYRGPQVIAASPQPQPVQPTLPEIDYQALIDAAYKRDKKWAQGTNGCIAFKHGAEWFRDQVAKAKPEQHPHPDDDATESMNETNAVLARRYFDLLRVVEAYEKHGVTCQTFRNFVDAPCAECNSAKPEQAAQHKNDPLHDDIQSVLFEVEQAIENGSCPWQIESAFEAYEAARRLQLPAHSIAAPQPKD